MFFTWSQRPACFCGKMQRISGSTTRCGKPARNAGRRLLGNGVRPRSSQPFSRLAALGGSKRSEIPRPSSVTDTNHIDHAALHAKYREEREKRIRPEGKDQYIEPKGRF